LPCVWKIWCSVEYYNWENCIVIWRGSSHRILQYKLILLMQWNVHLQSAALQDAQRVFNSVSEVMHFLSHAYHAMSDIMCEFSCPPPRNLRCRPVLIQHSAVLQAGIPIQVVIKFWGLLKSSFHFWVLADYIILIQAICF
jgi:hypothetical protein